MICIRSSCGHCVVPPVHVPGWARSKVLSVITTLTPPPRTKSQSKQSWKFVPVSVTLLPAGEKHRVPKPQLVNSLLRTVTFDDEEFMFMPAPEASTRPLKTTWSTMTNEEESRPS